MDRIKSHLSHLRAHVKAWRMRKEGHNAVVVWYVDGSEGWRRYQAMIEVLPGQKPEDLRMWNP